ncbi:hypothetical protein K8352_12185 [Flavobacteriaceae bacterium F89]|uniref:Uncharacterized protein n=1 Tax=Cerina litoralis TaxID=2874477 RepID=A0AAE3EXH7_9FLAO|nr:hypothetical protein [Cerina litoralis]MCG2461512.1 hypothetical protein [Cerina litoralis]
MRHRNSIPAKFPFQEELLELLKKQLQLHSVYVIGNIKESRYQRVNLFPRTTDSEMLVIYTLLIICHDPISKNLGEFMDDLYNKMGKQCKVYPIIYTLNNVMDKLDYGNNFLNRIVNRTPCIYQEDESLLRFGRFRPLHHKGIYEGIQSEWNSRMKRAGYLLSMVGIIDVEEEPAAKLCILHFTLEQICVALTYLFWEFKPYYCSLSYLMHLCGLFTRIPQTIFPQRAFGSQRMFYVLCNAHHQMRFKTRNEFSKKDCDKAYDLCERFFEEATTLGERQLENLKELHC